MSIPHNADGFVIGPDGFAESSADLLADFLIEHSDDPDEGPPESWPAWTSEIELALGAPSCREECLDAPDPDQPPDEFPLTGPEDLEELRHWGRFPALSGESEPDPDQADQLDRYLIDPELAHWIAYGNCRD